jgi:hypothetical protein
MLILVDLIKTTQGLTATIQGPKGTVRLRDLVWIDDRQDILEIYYWEAQSVLAGAYHCCLSIPGKLELL